MIEKEMSFWRKDLREVWTFLFWLFKENVKAWQQFVTIWIESATPYNKENSTRPKCLWSNGSMTTSLCSLNHHSHGKCYLQFVNTTWKLKPSISVFIMPGPPTGANPPLYIKLRRTEEAESVIQFLWGPGWEGKRLLATFTELNAHPLRICMSTLRAPSISCSWPSKRHLVSFLHWFLLSINRWLFEYPIMKWHC